MIPKPKKRKRSNKKHTEIDSQTYNTVYRRDGGCCVVCGSRSGLEQHHIKPRSRLGGGKDPSNLVMLCKDCHYNKLHGMGDYETKKRIYEYMIRLGYGDYRAELEYLQFKEGKL